jgi:hypothetical protein
MKKIFYISIVSVKCFDHLSTHKHNIADMSKKQALRDTATSKVEVRNVRFNTSDDSRIDTWRAKQKAKGLKLKRHQAVEELTLKGLNAEGI